MSEHLMDERMREGVLEDTSLCAPDNALARVYANGPCQRHLQHVADLAVDSDLPKM